MNKTLMFTFAFLLAVAMPVLAFTIDGDTVTWENSYGKVTQTPHTLVGTANYPEIEFTSYFSTTQNLDIAFGFAEPFIVPSRAEYYNPHDVETEFSYVCDGYFSYSLDPNYVWCYTPNASALMFEHEFDTGNLATKTVYWTETEHVEWTDISNKFDKITYDMDGKNTWYIIEDVEFEPYETKTIRLRVNVEPKTSGKYDIFIKRHVDTFNWAMTSGEYVLLDPWYDTDYQYCRDLENTTYWNASYPAYYNWTYDGDEQSDFDDVVFVDRECGNGGSAVPQGMTNKTNSAWASFKFNTDTMPSSVYYGNPTDPGGHDDWDGVFGSGLSFYASFDEITGTVAVDHVNGHNCVLTDTPARVSGLTGNAYDFERGDSNYMDCDDYNDGTTAISLCAWVKPESCPAATNEGAVISKGSSAGSGSYQLHLYANCQVKGNIKKPAAWCSGAFSTAELPTGSWSFICMTYDGTTIRNYINGTADGTNSCAGTISDSTDELLIGAFQATTHNFDGIIDDPRIYPDTTLSPGDIYLMYLETEPEFSRGSEQEAGTPTSISLFLDGFQSNNTYGYNPSRIVNSTGVVNVTGLWVAIDINGTTYTNGTTTVENLTTFGAGLYNITAWFGGNATYLSSSETWWLTIQQADNPLTFSIANTTESLAIGGNFTPCVWLPWCYGESVGEWIYNIYPEPMKATWSCAGGTTNATRNNVSMSGLNDTWQTLPVGDHIFVLHCAGNANYTTNYSLFSSNVSKGTPLVNFTRNTSDTVVQGTVTSLTCNKPGELSVGVWNDTGNVSNPYVLDTSGLDGLYNYTCETPGNANYTSGQDTNQLTVTLTSALIIHKVYDENNLSKTLTFDVNIYNSSYLVESTNISTYNNNEVRGELTITITADGYGSRRYYVTVPESDSYNMSGYLVNNSDGQSVSWNLLSVLQNPIPTGNIDLKRLYGSNKTTVAQGISDDTGKFVFFLDPDADYFYEIYANGFDNKSGTIIPIDTTYIFYLYKSLGDIPPFIEYWDQVNAGCSYTNATRTFSCSWNDTSGHLQNLTLNVTELTPTTSSNVCGNFSSDSSGTMNCVLPANFGNKTYSATLKGMFESTPTSFVLWSQTVTPAMVTQVLGLVGIFLTMILVLSSGFIGFSISPTTGIIMTIVSIVLSVIVNFLSVGIDVLAVLVGLTIAGTILVIKIEKT